MAESFELGKAITPDVCKDMKISTRVPEVVRMKFFNYFSKLTPLELKSIVHQPKDFIKVNFSAYSKEKITIEPFQTRAAGSSRQKMTLIASI